MKLISRYLILILVITVTISCSAKKAGKKGDLKLKTKVVEKGEITVKLEETGIIEPIKEIDIKSKISGKVLEFLVEEGDFVKKDQLIARVEPDYNQAETISRIKNNLELADIRLRNAETDYADQLQLFKDNYSSEKELRTYEDGLTEARINHSAAKQQFDLIKEIDTDGNVSNVISTASGTVIQKLVEEGEMVVASTNSFSEGTIVLKLADLERMIVNSRINEVDISKIRKHQKVEIQVDAYPYEVYTGVIYKIAAMAVDYNNIKVFPIEIEIDDVDEKLKPGMTANVTIIGEKKDDIVVVPIRAIFSNDDGEDIIYKVTNDTLTTEMIVKTGINNFQQVEIIDGIAVGDTISLTEPDSKKPDVDFQFD